MNHTNAPILTIEWCSSKSERDALLPTALSWIAEAGNPYFDWIFGNEVATARVLSDWMERSSSEVALNRIRFLRNQSSIVAGFIAMGGNELKKARRADAVCLLSTASVAERSKLIGRLTNVSDLFSPVDPGEYYLSKMGVNKSYRGQGLSRAIMSHYLKQGEAENYKCYRLDVCTRNSVAIRCYERYGFNVDAERRSRDGKIQYYSMSYKQSDR